MYRNDPIETMEIGNHRIGIYYDEDNECPVTNWDMGGIYLFEHLEHARYWLSNYSNWKEVVSNPREYSLADCLLRIAADSVSQEDIIKHIKAGKVNDVRLQYDPSGKWWELQHFSRYGSTKGQWLSDYEMYPSDLEEYDYRMELLEQLDEEELLELIQEFGKDIVIKAWESSGYSQGDHMRGIAYMTKERFDERCGLSGHYKTWQEQALAVIDGEIDCINKWAWGDVIGFVLEEKIPYTKTYEDGKVEEDFEWEEVDSCWGYYMEPEELIQEVIIEHGLKEDAA